MLTRVLFALVLIGGLALALGLSTIGDAVAQEETKIVAFGLTEHKVAAAELETGAALPVPHFNTPAVAYVLAANLKKGDTVEISLDNRDRALHRNARELEADEARVLLLAGKTGVPAGGWPEGTYTATLKITRDGKPLISETTKPIVFE